MARTKDAELEERYYMYQAQGKNPCYEIGRDKARQDIQEGFNKPMCPLNVVFEPDFVRGYYSVYRAMGLC